MAYDNFSNSVSRAVRSHVIEAVKFKVTACWTGLHGLTFDVETMVDMVTDDLLFTMQANLYSKTDKSDSKTTTERKSIKERVPLTWFDHFKEDKFPKWLLERYPCKYRTIEREIIKHTTTVTNVTKMCPHLPTDHVEDHHRFLIHDFSVDSYDPDLPYGVKPL